MKTQHIGSYIICKSGKMLLHELPS